jgi:hypothetical protein
MARALAQPGSPNAELGVPDGSAVRVPMLLPAQLLGLVKVVLRE